RRPRLRRGGDRACQPRRPRGALQRGAPLAAHRRRTSRSNARAAPPLPSRPPRFLDLEVRLVPGRRRRPDHRGGAEGGLPRRPRHVTTTTRAHRKRSTTMTIAAEATSQARQRAIEAEQPEKDPDERTAAETWQLIADVSVTGLFALAVLAAL